MQKIKKTRRVQIFVFVTGKILMRLFEKLDSDRNKRSTKKLMNGRILDKLYAFRSDRKLIEIHFRYKSYL